MKYPPKQSTNNSIKIYFIICNRVGSFIFFIFFFAGLSIQCFSQSHPLTDDEFVGPFPSWINVKTQFGAIGDGVADETAALQAAFNAIGNANSTASVVYLPAGTYRITGSLTMNGKMNVSVIGADPATTKIIWAGASGGTMFQVHGTAYSRFNRVTWDGNSVALIGIDQSRESASQGFFDTGNEYADDEFKNVGIGIRGGHFGFGFAEIAIMRCRFTSNTTAGITLGNFNAVDVWVWHSIFENCTVGITNANTTSSAGNFKVYNSIFRNSTNSDIIIGNTGEFAFRDNTSTNSQTFLKATFKTFSCHITLQSNTIIDPIASKAIEILNQGPNILLDNIIRSRAGAIAPVVVHNSFPSGDFFSMGNTFTVANAIQTNGRNIIYDKPVVSPGSLSALSEPSIPGTQPNFNRTVFEVPAGSNATAIQTIINQADLLTGTRPVVHFSHGVYNIQTTLNIPAGSDMQIVGDGDGELYPTWLFWTGGTVGPVINIAGPSKATLRDISIRGENQVTDILLTNVDQSGSRIFMHELEANLNANGLLINGLDNSLVLAQNSRVSQTTGKGINVIGGPFASSGNPQSGKTIMYGGLTWENNITHEVTNGGNYLVRDVWYESLNNGQYLSLSGLGTVTVEGSSVASPRGSAIPQISISNFSGKASLINSYFQDRVAISGNGLQTKFLGLGTLFGDNTLPPPSPSANYIDNTTSPPGDVRSFNTRSFNNPNLASPRSGSTPVNNIGSVDSTFIATMLQQLRTEHAQVVGRNSNGITDLRFYRVWLYKGTKGIDMQGILPFHFRSKQSGNWNDINTWESSADNVIWTAATIAPDYHANTITVRNNHVINVTANTTIDETIVNPTGAIVVTGSTLDVTNIFPTNGLTLQSDATGTARIGTSTGNITGNVNVERFISSAFARSAWRLLTTPLRSTTTNGTTFNNWQNGGVNTASRGTKVTGPAYNSTNGLDANTLGASMKWWDGVNQTLQPVITTNNSATTPLFTTSATAANQSYFTFIDGDRLASAASPNTTTLSATGSLQMGDQTSTLSSAGNAFNLIGNPYASPVDLNQLRLSNIANNVKSNYYYWNPYLTGSQGYGGYVTVSYDGSGNETITPIAVEHTRFLQNGQAMFVQTNTSAPASLVFKETQKNSTIVNNVFRTQTGSIEYLAVNLKILALGQPVLVDGVVTNFDNTYDAAIDQYDAVKLYNIGESISFLRNGLGLSVERRPMLKIDDVLYLNLANLKPGKEYQFEFVPDLNGPKFTAWLKDNYLNTLQPLSVNSKSTINFTITPDAVSTGANRFSIVFSNPAEMQTGKSFIKIYPNPVKGEFINLKFNYMPVGNYMVKILNYLGQTIVSTDIIHTSVNSIETVKLNKLVKGVYHLEITKPDNSKFSGKIISN